MPLDREIRKAIVVADPGPGPSVGAETLALYKEDGTPLVFGESLLPALTADGMGWMRVGGALVAVNLSTEEEIVSALDALWTASGNTNSALTTHKSSADHDGRYYTESEVNSLLAGKLPNAHESDTTDVHGFSNIARVPAMNAETGMRIIRGQLAYNAAIESGSGFSTTKLGTGSYRITFSPGFSSNPVVQLTMAESGGNWVCQLTSIGTGSCDYEVRNSSGSNVDKRVGFLAIGVA